MGIFDGFRGNRREVEETFNAMTNHGEFMWRSGYDTAIEDCCMYLNVVRKDLNLSDEQVEGIRKFYRTLKD